MNSNRRGFGETGLDHLPSHDILGDRACWGRVGYAGDCFAPSSETYGICLSLRRGFSSIQDSGALSFAGSGVANLHPLIAAAMYEAAFTMEVGPLVTGMN